MLNPISCFISFIILFSLSLSLLPNPTRGAPNVTVARTPTMLPLSLKVVWLVFASLGISLIIHSLFSTF